MSSKILETMMRWLLLVIVVCAKSAAAQSISEPSWQKGAGSASGTDIEAMRQTALNNARADALKKVGVIISTNQVLQITESGSGITDFYSQFVETGARGLILEERNIIFGEPTRLDGSLYKLTAELEAKVAVQTGSPDPAFEVSLKSDRNTVQDGESMVFEVTSTRDGYVTIFTIYNDSLSVVFPNAISKDNRIKATQTIKIPPPDAPYTLKFQVAAGKKSSSEEFIAVVTKDNVPFPNEEEIQFSARNVRLKHALLGVYANWLFRTPLERRSAAHKVVQINR